MPEVAGALEDESDDFAEGRLADLIEARAWRDMVAAAPPALELSARDVGEGLLLVTPRMPITQFNRVIGLAATRPVAGEELDAALDAFQQVRAQAFVHVTPSPHADALERLLSERGLPLAKRAFWAKMLRSTQAPLTLATRLAVREIDASHAHAFAETVGLAHDTPPPARPWIAALVGRPRWRAFAAFDGDTMVAGALVYLEAGCGWLGLGGTLRTHRRLGAQAALIAARVACARDAGCATVGTETGEPVGDEPNPSLANMYRCGFRKVASRKNYLAAPR